jgi:hypothetical protein
MHYHAQLFSCWDMVTSFLFPQAGLDLRSSWSHPLTYLRMTDATNVPRYWLKQSLENFGFFIGRDGIKLWSSQSHLSSSYDYRCELLIRLFLSWKTHTLEQWYWEVVGPLSSEAWRKVTRLWLPLRRCSSLGSELSLRGLDWLPQQQVV